jgi:hypothetical protein
VLKSVLNGPKTRLKGDFSAEAVLKVSVIEGKTGAPTIVAVHVW